VRKSDRTPPRRLTTASAFAWLFHEISCELLGSAFALPSPRSTTFTKGVAANGMGCAMTREVERWKQAATGLPGRRVTAP
jgi:hypothetical protein